MPADADGLTRLGVEGSREVRSLRLVDEEGAGAAAASSAPEGAASTVGRAEVEATGEAALSVCSGGVERGEGALSEMLFERRYIPIPESWRLSS